jgi:hypothetical protein
LSESGEISISGRKREANIACSQIQPISFGGFWHRGHRSGRSGLPLQIGSFHLQPSKLSRQTTGAQSASDSIGGYMACNDGGVRFKESSRKPTYDSPTARMLSVASVLFQPNKPNIICMDSNETCTCCGKELVSRRCLRRGHCERCDT